MSRAAQKLISASGGKAYEIEQSIKCSEGDASKLRRTPSSEGNRKTFTFSTWCKRSKIGSHQYLMGAFVSAGGSTDDSHYFAFGFNSSDEIAIGGWTQNFRYSNRKFRDSAAWYHLVLQVDTTQGTADNRMKIYVNGVQETDFGTKNNVSQNYDLAINNTVAQSISDTAYDQGTGPYHFDGYMAETHLFDGAVVAPSEFGETDSATGQWIPKKYVGTASYGTNGYYMPWKKNDRYSPYFTGANTTGIAVADSTDWDFGSGDFTMEAWVYRHEDLGQDGYVMGQCSSSTGANAGCSAFLLVGSNNTLYGYAFDASNTNNYVTLNGGSVADNKWYHVAMSRNGSTWKLFLDGTAVSTVTSSIAVNNVGDVFGVGKLGIYTAGHWQGWISNARVVKGTAVYTSDFTPSTTPLTAVTNTVLLCCQDKNVTTDNSGTSKSLSVTASQVWTEQMAPFEFDWYQDQSGQDNHYQADNLTVDDVMLDSPTNNFPTFNYLNTGSNMTLTQGGLKTTGSGWADTFSTMKVPFTGKWYWELLNTTNGNGYFGIWTDNYTDTDASQDYGTGKQATSPGNLSGVSGYFSSAWSSGDIIAMAVDCDNGKLWWSKNGVWGGTNGNPATGANQGLTFTATDGWNIIITGASGFVADINFGQNGTFNGYHKAQGNADGAGIGNFYYTPPSGFRALCSKNLPKPAVIKSSEHFDTILYTGDASAKTISGLEFAPDFLWIKNRSSTYHHGNVDRVRGATKLFSTSQNIAEITTTEQVKTFTSDGFTLGDNSDSNNYVNINSHNYAAWCWKAGGSGSANNSGDINATVSANTTAGFSIVTFTANGSDADTIAHGLGVVPKIAIKKDRDSTGDWHIRTTAIDGSNDYLALNGTDGHSTLSANYGSMTSQFVTNSASANGSSEVFYVFAEVEGFSKFGTYEGNNNANGPFITTGFTPAWIIFKHTDGNGEWWWMLDSTRDPYGNLVTEVMYPNATTAESGIGGSGGVDFLSNGFKIRATNGGINGNTNSYFYMAFAEFPFKYANAR